MKIYRKGTSVTKSVLGICAGLILLVSAFSGSLPTASAKDGADELFSDALRGTPQLDLSGEAYVSRSRFVSVNLDLLLDENGKALSADQLPQVALNIFPDASYTGKVEKVQKVAGSTSWSGTLAEVHGGYFYLVVNEGMFIAHVASTEGVYEISSVGEGVYQAIQIDQSKFLDDNPGELDEPGPVLSEEDLGVKADGSSLIDVMVVYTPEAIAGEGSLSALKARIALAVTETNTSYANSGVTTRIRLVHTEIVPYTETGNMSIDLSRLVNTSDGYMDDVHKLRGSYGADMVSLVVNNGGAYCGMAARIMATAATAFQVTTRNGCMTGYYAFGHDFGHLQGARHDVYADPATTPYAYGHGYVHTGSTAAARWRTMMASNDRCTSLGYNCTRLQYWSNPNKTWYGASMGVYATSRNYQVLNNTDYAVANFRQAVIGSNFTSTFTSSSAGWAAVKGIWGLINSNFYTSPGLANNSASAMHIGKYRVI